MNTDNTTPTTGEDDVERVARALYEQANRNLDCDTPPAWEDADAQCQEWNRASARAALAAISPTTEDDEEGYEIGKREGYEQAVQDIDVLTGGDGEYVASTLPERDCRDAPAMKARIVERFKVLSPTTEDAEKLQRTLVNFVQTPDWSPSAEPPEDNADWRAGYEAAQSNLREALKPWWPLGQYLALASIGERS